MTISATSPAAFARVVGALLGLAALLAALVITASPASAHARLESSSPADGSTLTAVPPEVMLRFNEPVKDGLNEVSVTSGSTDVAKGGVEVEGSSVYQPVDHSMKPGEYTVTYKVVSADGHPVSGKLSFTYEPPEGDRGAGADPSATTSSSESATSGGTGSSETSSSSSPTGEDPSGTASGSGDSATTSETSESSSTSPSGSGTAAPSDDPSETSGTSSPTSDEVAEDVEETSGDDGVSPWWWAGAAAVLAVLLGGAALLAKGRRTSGEDEDVTLEDRRG